MRKEIDMDGKMDYTREELEAIIEKSKRELEERLSKMTPEERAETERKAQKAIEEDNARIQKILDDAAKYFSDKAQKENEKPAFCKSCGAPTVGGNFCEYCGAPLK